MFFKRSYIMVWNLNLWQCLLQNVSRFRLFADSLTLYYFLISYVNRILVHFPHFSFCFRIRNESSLFDIYVLFASRPLAFIHFFYFSPNSNKSARASRYIEFNSRLFVFFYRWSGAPILKARSRHQIFILKTACSDCSLATLNRLSYCTALREKNHFRVC